MQWFSEFMQRRQKRRELRNFFDPYVPAALIKEMVANPDLYSGISFAEGPVGFLLVAVTADTALEISANIGRVTSLARSGNWLTQSLVSNVVVLTDGTLPSREKGADRHALAAQLMGELQTHVKIVYGVQVASYGDYGGDLRRVFGAILPCFLEAMAMLHSLEFGKFTEYIEPRLNEK